MRVTRAALPALLALVVLAPGLVPGAAAADRAASDPVQVVALAVAEDASGTFVGVHATVTAQVLAGGSGQVYVATKPLAQTDMQGSARLASRVAAATLGADWGAHDYLVSFTSDSAVIGGPSAGAVMTLALTVALHNLLDPQDAWTLDAGVAATGTINPDGTVGPVGGIPAKAEGARDAGLRLFLYPAGLDVATTQVDGRTVAVDMREHCAALGIACRATATLADLLAEAAGADLRLPDEDVPGTAGYEKQLAPSVEAQVAELDARLAATRADARRGGLSTAERSRIDDEAATAQERLEAARAALGEDRFYLAATRSFQGAIAVGRAENLTAFYDQDRSRAVLTAAVRECQASAEAAGDAVDGLAPDGLNDVYAIGAAQQRAALARALAAQAAQQAQTNLVEEAIVALGTAAFCDERADTVGWWADLRAPFGPGPDVADLDGLARDSLDEARDLVAYAVAVLGTAPDAEARLQEAAEHLAASRPAAAVLSAVEAQTAASVAMQTGGGAAVPAEVLEAARQGAARAVNAARADGIEPVLAVALLELAQDEGEPDAALASLWSARSLALLARAQPTAADVDGPGSAPPGAARTGGLAPEARWAGAVLLGLGLAALVLALVALRRR